MKVICKHVNSGQGMVACHRSNCGVYTKTEHKTKCFNYKHGQEHYFNSNECRCCEQVPNDEWSTDMKDEWNTGLDMAEALSPVADKAIEKHGAELIKISDLNKDKDRVKDSIKVSIDDPSGKGIWEVEIIRNYIVERKHWKEMHPVYANAKIMINVQIEYNGWVYGFIYYRFDGYDKWIKEDKKAYRA